MYIMGQIFCWIIALACVGDALKSFKESNIIRGIIFGGVGIALIIWLL